MTVRNNDFIRYARIPVLVGIALGMLSAPSGVTASTVVLMELDALVAESDSIVQGIVEHVESRWEDSYVFTYVTVRIDDPLKGDRSRTLTIRQVGGSVGDRDVFISGMPRFEPGMGLILFLTDSQNGTFHVTGMNQGSYVISQDYAISNISGVDLLSPKSGIVSSASVVKRVEVEQFKARIRELVQ